MGHLREAQAAIAGVADQLLAADNPRIGARALIEEGEILAELGEPERARPLLDHAIAILSMHPKGGGAIAEANAHLADLETGTGNPSAARARLQVFPESAGYGQGPPKMTLKPVLVSAGRAELALGEFSAAQAHVADALALAEKVARRPDSSADVGEILMTMAHIKLAVHEPAAVGALLTRALRCLSNGLGPDAPPTLEACRMVNSGAGQAHE
jgi:hypothetical protein